MKTLLKYCVQGAQLQCYNVQILKNISTYEKDSSWAVLWWLEKELGLGLKIIKKKVR